MEIGRKAAPFHIGELQAQERAGVRSQMDRVGAVALRDYMPEQHREFFPLLPTLFVGAGDDEGALWASMLWGEAGFIRSPDPAVLRIAAQFAADDPLAAVLRPGTAVGLLGLQFETRRRNRANGIVSAVDARGFDFALEQSFGNCPKYIQTREQLHDAADEEPLPAASGNGRLPEAAVALIRAADTFFIATAAGADSGPAHGADVSHRGGRPGFVRVDPDGSLAWPDYQGNNFFNTIGNLMTDDRAGLLFIDFARGDLLHLSGCAEVDWDSHDAARLQGARRVLRFRTERHVFRPRALPLRWVLKEQSPYLDQTGVRG